MTAAALPLRSERVLEIVAPAALEPIRFRGKIRHRVGKHCVEIDAATWASTHQIRMGYDWSAQPSTRTLEQLPGPLVRTTLLGGEPDHAWLELRARMWPTNACNDLDFLLLLDTTARRGWVSGPMASAAMQRSRAETADVLERLTHVTVEDDGKPLFVEVDGDPYAGQSPYDAAWQLSNIVRTRLDASRRRLGPSRDQLLTNYVRERGRISSTEAASLLGSSANTARTALEDLERDGVLASGRPQRRGRGFFYVPA